MKPTGDDHLSGFDHKLWSLHQQVLFKFNCYTIFKLSLPNYRDALPGFIQWFVPKDHPLSYEVVKYLEYELEKEKIEPAVGPGGQVWPGTNVLVIVMPYSGIEPYLERDKLEALAKQFSSEFIQKINKLQKEKRGPSGPPDPAQKPTQ